jgi:hypothetical protein
MDGLQNPSAFIRRLLNSGRKSGRKIMAGSLGKLLILPILPILPLFGEWGCYFA